MSMLQEVSVIIPTYNREKTIKKSIDSVLCQTYPVREIIIADDCSTDGTEQLIVSWEDDRIRYCRLPENRGAGGARNYGVKQAKSELIAFHDSDDEWLPTKLEKQMNLWCEHQEYGLIYTAYRMHLMYGIEHIVPNLDRNEELYGDIFKYLLVQNTIGAPTVLTRKSIFEEVGGFDEKMKSLEDWDFALKVAKKWQIGFVPEPLLEVAQTQGGVSSKQAEYYQNRCYMLRKYRQDFLVTNTFERTVEGILSQAKADGILEQIEKMIMLYLSS